MWRSEYARGVTFVCERTARGEAFSIVERCVWLFHCFRELLEFEISQIHLQDLLCTSSVGKKPHLYI